jgi:GMP synthase-like glutamine amidotransferase
MKTIAFIDPFGQTPVNKCVNSFIIKSGIPCTYHMPSQYGFDSLETLEQADAYVILGSVAHVTEDLEWQRNLLKFIIPKIEAGIPTLGICYGHQLIAHHYGCKVDYISKDQQKREEAREVKFEMDALGKKKGDTLTLAYAHAQMVHTISDKFEHFMSSEVSPYDGLKLKGLPCWLVQPHPEASERFIKEDANVSDDKLFNKVINNSYEVLLGFANEL